MRLVKVKTSNHANWEDIIEEFLLYKTAEKLAKRTVSDYARMIKCFYKKYPNAYKNPKKYALMFLSEDIKPATYNLRLNYLKAFFTYCVEEEYLKENPLQNLKRKKAEPRIVNIDLDILRKLLTLPDKKTYTGLRDYTIMLLQLDTGIRPSEAFNLMMDDVDLDTLQVTIKAENAKTRKSRVLPISSITAKAIRKLITSRAEVWGNAPLLCSCEGTAMNASIYWHRLNEYSKKLGYHISPYDLRHAFALNFLRNEGNVFALQRTLGHSDLSMTKRYIALTQEDLKIQHQKASPLNTLISTRIKKV